MRGRSGGKCRCGLGLFAHDLAWCVCMYTCVYVNMSACVCVCVSVYMYVYAHQLRPRLPIFSYSYTNTYIYMHTRRLYPIFLCFVSRRKASTSIAVWSANLHTPRYCTAGRDHAYNYRARGMYVRMYVRMYACMYACMCV